MPPISIRSNSQEKSKKNNRRSLLLIIITLIFSIAFFGGVYIFLKKAQQNQPKQPAAQPTLPTLPTLDIRTDTEIPWEKKITCVVNQTLGNSAEAFAGKIKCHGGYSSRYEKHSFSLELTDKVSIAGLSKDDDYILNANYIDKTFMRHKISYDLFREMNPSANIAPSSSYANLRLNGKDNGLYVIMQKVTAKVARLDKDDNGAMLFKEPPIFHEIRLENPEEPENYYQQKFPKIKNQDCKATMDSLHDFLFHSSDEIFAEKISYWFDLQNVIDWHILLLFTNNSDGLLKNFYLYRIKTGEPFRIIPWDYDHSFGRDGDGEKNLLTNIIDCNRCVLLKRLMENPTLNYTEQLAKRYNELRAQGILSVEHFKEMIKRNEDAMSGGLKRNFELWPINDGNYFDSASHQEEVDLMIQYVGTRLSQLDAKFSKK